MVSSRSWKNSNFNRVLSLALCVGVAFLLLAGSVFAGTTALVGNVNRVALQSGKAATVYTIPAASYSASYTRTMAVARQAVSGNFFLDVNLQNGFTFNAGRVPAATDIGWTTTGTGTIGAITLFQASASSYRFLVPVTVSFTTAPVLTIATSNWMVNDPAGYLSGTASVTTQIELRTYDANTAVEFDSGVNSANFITAVNALSAAIGTTTATVDTAAGSARKNLVIGADTATQDLGATLTITVGGAAAPAATSVQSNLGVAYTMQAGDFLNLTITGNLSGIKYVYYNFGGGANQIRQTVAAADVTNGYVVIPIPNTNSTIATLANGNTGAVPLAIEVDGTTQLTTRSFTAGVEATCAYNAANNRTGANALVAPGAALSTWGINGTVLLANFANANTAAFKSRFYLFNETSTANATVIIRMFQLPISSNATAPTAQLGNTVTLSKTLGAVSGMTIRLEDIITASGATATDLAGPDNSYNVAVEITVYTQGVGAMVGGVTGYTQTMNLAGTTFLGTTPLSKIQ